MRLASFPSPGAAAPCRNTIFITFPLIIHFNFHVDSQRPRQALVEAASTTSLFALTAHLLSSLRVEAEFDELRARGLKAVTALFASREQSVRDELLDAHHAYISRHVSPSFHYSVISRAE